MKTSTKAAAAERPQAAAAVRQAAAGRRKQAAWRTAAAAASAGGRRRPPAAGGRSCIFRKGCVNVKYSGATRARSLCFIGLLVLHVTSCYLNTMEPIMESRQSESQVRGASVTRNGRTGRNVSVGDTVSNTSHGRGRNISSSYARGTASTKRARNPHFPKAAATRPPKILRAAMPVSKARSNDRLRRRRL